MRNEIYHRELRWMELVAVAMHIFVAIFGSFAKVLLFIFLPISLLESIILGRMNAVSAALDAFTQMANPSTANLQEMMGLLGQLMTQEFLLYAILMFLQPVGTLAIARMVKQYIDGEKPEAGKAIGEALNHMPAILITGFLFGVLVLLGSFVIVPGVYFGVAWGLYSFCIIFEDKKGWDALRSSKRLVQGKWWKTLGYLFMLSCVTMLWNSVFQMVCTFFGESVMVDILYQFLCYISVGFVAVGECLLYLNRKAVKEGAGVFRTPVVEVPVENIPVEPVDGTVEGEAEEIIEENENK